MGLICSVYNYCVGNVCSNCGLCKIINNDYRCDCNGGFKGKDCEMMDYCFGKNCNNKGYCISNNNKYICNCNV